MDNSSVLWLIFFFLALVLTVFLIWLIVSKTTQAPYLVIDTGQFVVFNTDVCIHLPTCFGQNPDSPYARLIFRNANPLRKLLQGQPLNIEDAANLAGAFSLEPNQAVIIRGVTPPKCRYFGFTLYLFNQPDGFVPFASLGDTINETDLDFNQKFSIIVTGSIPIGKSISSYMKREYPNEPVLILPVPMLDTVKPGDTLLIVMRTAYFQNEQLGQAYLNKLPVTGTLVKSNISPGQLYGRQPLDVRPDSPNEIVYAGQFQSYIDQQLAIIENNTSFISLDRELPFHPFLSDINYDSGYDCIDKRVECLGDNRDAAYIISDPFDLGFNQAVIVMGVNHVQTDKAVYTSQSLYDYQRQFGISSFSDSDLPPGSLFYTFAFTRQPISGLPFPQYVIHDLGVSQVTLAERAYVQPGYHVGPQPNSLIWPQGYLVTVKPSHGQTIFALPEQYGLHLFGVGKAILN